MNGLLAKQIAYTSVLVFVAMMTAVPLAIFINAIFFPPLHANTLEITALVTAIVAIPLCAFTASQAVRHRVARSRLAEQKLSLLSAKKEAERAVAARSRFLAFMSHEIRTPLNGMLGTAQLLHAQHLNSEQRRLVQVMNDSGQILMSLLNDVLDFTKIEAGELEIAPVECALRSHIRRMVSLFEAEAQNKGLTLEVSIGEDVPERAVADTTRLGQCLGNLLSNAIKFTETGGVFVDVGLRRQTSEDVLVIDVQDTGAGIDDEAQVRIFEPFAQADKTVQTAQGGTGLGLAICRELALRQGGDLTVTSRLGDGACFRLKIAVASIANEGEAPASTMAKTSGQALADKRVLIVDDTDTNRLIVRMFLQQNGAETLEAENGMRAVEIAVETEVDLVLLDMEMPVMDGCQTAARLRVGHGPDLPIIAVTANATPEDREAWRKLGIQGYIPKPIDRKVFDAEVFGALKLYDAPITDAA